MMITKQLRIFQGVKACSDEHPMTSNQILMMKPYFNHLSISYFLKLKNGIKHIKI